VSTKRQKNRNQLELAFMAEMRGEAPSDAVQGTEVPASVSEPESPAAWRRLMEAVCEPANLNEAYKRVRKNKGSPGIDGMTVKALKRHLLRHGAEIRTQLLNGTYRPPPVKRVAIPKPGGGERMLGIPTVVDRFVQQAVLQVLQREWDPTFSEHSYGFRPERSAHQAVDQAQAYLQAGYGWVVDVDLEKFFDRVNHDVLMGLVRKRVEDERVLKLIRAYLNAGVMENGMVSWSGEGTPQGGPLSPLLSNLVLDVLDQELTKRGHRFVRYADDCNIYVGSRRAGERVMGSVSRFLEARLRLRVNKAKSAVDRPQRRKFLGFSFLYGAEAKVRLAPTSVARFKGRIRELTAQNLSLTQLIKELGAYLRGWQGYFGHCQTPKVLRDLDSWVRRRLRCVAWRQWKWRGRRYDELVRRGVKPKLAAHTVISPKGPWRMSRSPALNVALPNAGFDRFGLPRLEPAQAA
jgi:RNA-directed DNA polymerase